MLGGQQVSGRLVVLTNVWVIQDLHYFDFSEKLQNRQTRRHVLLIYGPNHVGPTSHQQGADSLFDLTIQDQALGNGRKWI